MTENNRKKALILIVDDDLATRLLMRASLEKSGFQVTEAENGLVALDVYKQMSPDAILMDVMMPKLDGFDTCREIRKIKGGEHIPVLMVTGLEDIEAIHRCYDSGATDFITKPINWAILNYRVKYMLRASTAFNDVIDKQRQIQELAFFDHLTGLANRTMFKETLENALSDCEKTDLMLAVMFMDLDRFKTINDTLGHHVGDMLLKHVSDRISSCVRGSDAIGRFNNRQTRNYISRLGGDEFTIMVPELKDPDNVALIARRLNESLSAPFVIDGSELFISTSIGISIYPLDGTNAEDLMKHADLAMYHAKERGKNGFQFYKKQLNIKAVERLEFENDVRKAVQNEEFVLHFQPQIDMQTGRIIAAEALTRWVHQQHGPISPGQFIPAIEDLGLITLFTDWVIRQAGKQLSGWRDKGVELIRIALNVSSKQFMHQQIPDKISTLLEQHKLDGDLIELELTESVLAEQNADTLAILSSLKELGLAISVDDFGTGYSSLVYLKSFPIDIVKIDRFFVKDILTSKQDSAIVKAIVALAHSMEMKVIAEGIEELEQYRLLREIGCDYGQGYLFSPAVPAEVLQEMIVQKQILVDI